LTIPILTSALAAAIAAYIFNRVSRRLAGRTTVVFIAPGLEESFKTGAALLTGAPVLVTHIVFGAIEAVYDLVAPPPGGRAAGALAERQAVGWAGPAVTDQGMRRAGAAAASLGGHALFGSVTLVVAGMAGSWPVGVAAAYGLHVGWNALVTGKVRARS
jgi:hypothetical protein